jgi:hypothetical protein
VVTNFGRRARHEYWKVDGGCVALLRGTIALVAAWVAGCARRYNRLTLRCPLRLCGYAGSIGFYDRLGDCDA